MNLEDIKIQCLQHNLSFEDFENFLSTQIKPEDYTLEIVWELFKQSRIWIYNLQNNIAFKDTQLLFEKWNNVEKHLALINNVNYCEGMSRTCFEAGRKIFLEVTITDEYMSNMIFMQMYAKNSDNINGINSMGMIINAMHFNDPNQFSANELDILEAAQHLIQTKILKQSEHAL